jgi:hypothetical protein
MRAASAKRGKSSIVKIIDWFVKFIYILHILYIWTFK